MSDDRRLITAEQLAALRPLLRHPTHYTQRLTEHLEFLPQGGQQWRRDLQILIPDVEGLPKGKDHWFIVTLGQFERRRLPDFTVTDCSGRGLNLVTRVQHGHCLADFTLDRYLLEAEREALAAETNPKSALVSAYRDVYLPTFEMFTSVRKDLASIAEQNLVSLLELLGEREDRAERRAELFMEDMTGISGVTQYLCWVRARAGTPVRLTVTYTMPDRLRRKAQTSRTRRSRLYAALGVAPMHSSFPTPANDHASSYYFSLEPPAESDIPYLDWGLDNTLEGDGQEWVCAHSSVHVHNGGGLRAPSTPPKKRKTIPGSQIHAFFRLDPGDHKQVMFAALLNLVFVWLAEAGRLSPDLEGASAPWLAVAPAVLLAYTAQQRRHYFARDTRWLGVVLWGYLVLNIVFLVSISFDIASGGSFADRHGISDDAVSIVMASASVVVFWLFGSLGWPYDWIVRRRFEKRREHKGPKGESALQSYGWVARWYGDVVAGLTVVSLLAMACLLLLGWGPDRGEESAAGPSETEQLVEEKRRDPSS